MDFEFFVGKTMPYLAAFCKIDQKYRFEIDYKFKWFEYLKTIQSPNIYNISNKNNVYGERLSFVLGYFHLIGNIFGLGVMYEYCM